LVSRYLQLVLEQVPGFSLYNSKNNKKMSPQSKNISACVAAGSKQNAVANGISMAAAINKGCLVYCHLIQTNI